MTRSNRVIILPSLGRLNSTLAPVNDPHFHAHLNPRLDGHAASIFPGTFHRIGVQ